MLTSALTYGIKKAKWKAIVRAPNASMRLPNAAPVFYFYFEQRSSGLGGSGGFIGWMSGAEPKRIRFSKDDRKVQRA